MVLGMGSGGSQGCLSGALGWEATYEGLWCSLMVPAKSAGAGSCLGGSLVLGWSLHFLLPSSSPEEKPHWFSRLTLQVFVFPVPVPRALKTSLELGTPLPQPFCLCVVTPEVWLLAKLSLPLLPI